MNFKLYFFKITQVPWPSADYVDGVAGTLEQKFSVGWQSNSSYDTLELEFEGLSGSFVGKKGRPGVFYNPELGTYKANVIFNKLTHI